MRETLDAQLESKGCEHSSVSYIFLVLRAMTISHSCTHKK